ncbi:MAG: hypothetical protein QXE42_01255 [Candidatus Aenigmatarchaeota archaeon]
MLQKISEAKISKIKKEFISSMNKHFGKNLCFAFNSGRVAFRVIEFKKSDFDIAIVLSDSIFRDPPKFLTAKRKFMEDYFIIHKKFKLVPDYMWPGEYLTLSHLEDAVRGRCFELVNGRINLPYLKINEELYGDRLYRYWWGMLCFSEFLAGDFTKYIKLKKESLETLFKFLFYKFGQINKAQSFEQIFENIAVDIRFLGIRKEFLAEYYKMVLPYVNEILHNLIRSNLIIKTTDGYAPTKKIKQWAKEIKKKISDKKWNSELNKLYYL